MPTIHVNLGPRSYDVAIGSSDRSGFLSFFEQRFPHRKNVLVVCDSNTQHLAAPLITSLGDGATLKVVPAGEASKSMEQMRQLYSALAAIPADRKTPVVAVGGGVIGDLAGFAAATYNRGIPLFMVPTTLLAMVDSSVGGKVGINLPEGKNLVGSFHQPAGVWIDTDFLGTLPDREFRSGLAEVVKYGVILDEAFFSWLEVNAEAILKRDPQALAHVVARSCELKAYVVERDEREETGLRMVLNYGHTFAHAFESVGGYGTWLHGEAVAAGMVYASRTAESRGMIPDEATERQIALLKKFLLPTKRLAEWNSEELLAVMRRDKKNTAGRLKLVLPTRIGEVVGVDDVPESTVMEILN
jgi:3-dehydroquinate synthase